MILLARLERGKLMPVGQAIRADVVSCLSGHFEPLSRRHPDRMNVTWLEATSPDLTSPSPPHSHVCSSRSKANIVYKLTSDTWCPHSARPEPDGTCPAGRTNRPQLTLIPRNQRPATLQLIHLVGRTLRRRRTRQPDGSSRGWCCCRLVLIPLLIVDWHHSIRTRKRKMRRQLLVALASAAATFRWLQPFGRHLKWHVLDVMQAIWKEFVAVEDELWNKVAQSNSMQINLNWNQTWVYLKF